MTGEQSLSGVMLLALAKIAQLWLRILVDNNIKHKNDKNFFIYYVVYYSLFDSHSDCMVPWIAVLNTFIGSILP